MDNVFATMDSYYLKALLPLPILVLVILLLVMSLILLLSLEQLYNSVAQQVHQYLMVINVVATAEEQLKHINSQ